MTSSDFFRNGKGSYLAIEVNKSIKRKPRVTSIKENMQEAPVLKLIFEHLTP